jgi:hypothetical protein
MNEVTYNGHRGRRRRLRGRSLREGPCPRHQGGYLTENKDPMSMNIACEGLIILHALQSDLHAPHYLNELRHESVIV